MANLSNINNKFLVTTGGDVGIGTTGPNFALQVSGTNKNIQLGASTTVTTSNDIRHIFSGAAHFIGQDSLGEANIGNNAYYNSGFKRRNAGLASNIRHNAGNIYLQIAASAAINTAITWVDAMTIDPSGNVGINTTPRTSANKKLLSIDSAWGGQLDIGVSGTSHAQFGTDNYSTGLSARVQSKDGIVFKINGGSTNAQTIDASGNTDFVGTVAGTIARFDTLNNNANSANIIYRSGTDTIVGGGSPPDKIYIQDGGNVGIGTTSPYTNLEIEGSGADALIRLYAAGGTADIRTWEIRAVGVAGEGLLFRQVNDANSVYTNRMIIDTDGYVGIGTITPESKLAVKGTSGDADLFSISDVGVPTSGAEYGVAMIKTASTEFALNVTSYSLTGKGVRIYNNGADAARTSFEVLQGAGSRFIVDGIGNVGIGTTSPEQKLTIDGTVSGAYVRISNAASGDVSSGYMIYNGSNLDFNVYTNPTFGNTTLLSREALAIRAGGAERMRIDSNGNVGIGVTSPSYKLSVSTTLSSGSHLNADFGDQNSPTAAFVGQGGNVYDSGGIYRSTTILSPSTGAITTLFLSTYSTGHWQGQPTFQLIMNGTYYRGGYVKYWCQGVPASSIKNLMDGPYGTMTDGLSVTTTNLCASCHSGQPIDRQDWSFTTYGGYIRVSPIIITNKVGRRYFNNSSISALNTLQSSASPIGPAYFFYGISDTEAAGSSDVYTIT